MVGNFSERILVGRTFCALGIGTIVAVAAMSGCSSSSNHTNGTDGGSAGGSGAGGSAATGGVGGMAMGGVGGMAMGGVGGMAMGGVGGMVMDGGGGMCTGGPTTGPADTHCAALTDAGTDAGLMTQVTGQCVTNFDAGPPSDAGIVTAGGDYGPTHNGTVAYDDDCKYHVAWESTPICESSNVTFTVGATKTVGGGPLTGAAPYLESYKIESDHTIHFAQNAPVQTPTEESAGPYTIGSLTFSDVYKVGPLVFDEPGQWLIRFHFYEECSDDPDDSPHGHAAFYINVP